MKRGIFVILFVVLIIFISGQQSCEPTISIGATSCCEILSLSGSTQSCISNIDKIDCSTKFIGEDGYNFYEGKSCNEINKCLNKISCSYNGIKYSEGENFCSDNTLAKCNNGNFELTDCSKQGSICTNSDVPGEIVSVAYNPKDGLFYTFYSNGKYSVGNYSNLANIRNGTYFIDQSKTYDSIKGIDLTPSGYSTVVYSGNVSSQGRDVEFPNNLANYSCSSGCSYPLWYIWNSSNIVEYIGGANPVAFYANGYYCSSPNQPHSLTDTACGRYIIAPGESYENIVGITYNNKNGFYYTYYKDGTYSIGAIQTNLANSGSGKSYTPKTGAFVNYECSGIGINENKKDLIKYSNKEVFLISDKNWKDVLQLVPLTTWTDQSGEINKYPTLIYHEEAYVDKLDLSNIFFPIYLSTSKKTSNIYNIKDFSTFKDILDYEVSFDKNIINVGESTNYKIKIKNILNEAIEIKALSLVSLPYKNLNIINVNGCFQELLPQQECILKVEFKFESPFKESFDADSIIYFMQQYNTEKVTIVGDTPKELDNLLITAPQLGAGLTQDKIQRISINNYLSYWDSFKDVVYVEDNYELALLASTYASLINAPLIIQGTSLDVVNNFNHRNVILVGSVSCPVGAVCNEPYTLEQLQQKYIELTNTDKIILVNPDDLNIKVGESFLPEKSVNPINFELYSKTSLTAPILASAKHELILSTISVDYLSVDSFIKNKISSLQLNPEYLTIIASPNAIDMSYEEFYSYGGSSFYSTDAWYYSNFDDDPFLDLAVGRIFGITISDSSSNIARSLFYEETLKNADKILVTRGYPYVTTAAEVYAMGKVFGVLGYQTTTTPKETNVLDWKNKFFISYNDHGSPTWAGISSSDIPYLDNSFVYTLACSTCDFKDISSKSSLFCANAIRKGAIGYVGTVYVAGGTNQIGFLADVFAQESTIGKAFINSKNSKIILDQFRQDSPVIKYNPMPWFLLLGDPTLKLKTIYKMPKPKLDYITEDQEGKDYKLVIPVMKIEIPDEVKNLCQNPDQVVPLYFTTAYNGQLDSNYIFSSRFDSQEGFEPMAVFLEGWQLIKESTNLKNMWWIINNLGNRNPYFTTASGSKFTDFEFNLKLLKTAPDFTIENIKLTGQTLSFDVRNIGNKEGIAKGEGMITFGGYDQDSFDSKYIYTNLDILNGEFDLMPNEIKSFSIILPNQDYNGNNFYGHSYYKFWIDPRYPTNFIQQKYYNDLTYGEFK